MAEALYKDVGTTVYTYQRLQHCLERFVDWMSGTSTASTISETDRVAEYAQIGEHFFGSRPQLAGLYPGFVHFLVELDAMRAQIASLTNGAGDPSTAPEWAARSIAASHALADLFDATAYPHAPPAEFLRR